MLADGKLYVGTENTGDAGGKFYIIKPGADKAEILDQDWLGTPQKSEQIIASPIVARGRVYVTSMDALYAIGPKTVPAARPTGGRAEARRAGAGPATVAAGHADRADPEAGRGDRADGSRVRREGQRRSRIPGAATWTLENLKGTIADGKFTADTAATSDRPDW